MTESDSLGRLSPEALVMFSQGLAGLDSGEIRKLKILYVRNTLTELRAEIETLEAGYSAGCIHWCIPLFWPFAFAERRQIGIRRRRGRDLFLNLLAVWREDLEGEEFDYDFLLENPD